MRRTALQHVPRQSPEFLHFVGQLLDQHAAMQARPAPTLPPPMPAMPRTPAHIDVERTEHNGEPEDEPMASHYVSAPVSRGEAGHSIDPELLPSQITLSKAEREHAAAAGISEIEYGKQKLKMQRMKKSRIIKD
jgi:hypothetical protein